MIDELEEPQPQPGLARSAALLSAGNIGSRILGLVREMVIAYYFGTTGYASAFRSVNRTPRLLYDLLVGGMMSAALVPVLSEYAARKDKAALWEAFSAILTLLTLVLAVVALAVSVGAVPLIHILIPGLDPVYQAAGVKMLRLMAWAILFFGVSGLLTGLLFTLQRFTFPAFTTAVFNLGIVLTVPVLAGRFDVYSLAIGTIVGSLSQTLLLMPGLLDAKIRPHWEPLHPALVKVWKLYLPLLAGLLVGQAQVLIDTNLASRTGQHSLAWMQNATTLRELPLGLISMAISAAVLPRLSQNIASGDTAQYRQTLGYVLRLVILLTVPAAVGLAIFAKPLVQILFQRGVFTATDTRWTSLALWGYLPGLFFASIDWPINYSFYARQDTKTPTIVGIAAVLAYLAVALALLHPLGMLGLVIADSSKHAFHAITMTVLLYLWLRPVSGRSVLVATGRALVAAGAMAVVGVAANRWIGSAFGAGMAGALLDVAIGGGAAVAVYFLSLVALGDEDTRGLWKRLWGRIKR
jgi:putative peptidoglycan lipid II flippase